ncbi:MAG: PQQ-dependent sugar dehydrogenase [Myxococcales bacterium]|nr:PQQ-dependent sugar dehydrogenase [Myxococcales bacterium]
MKEWALVLAAAVLLLTGACGEDSGGGVNVGAPQAGTGGLTPTPVGSGTGGTLGMTNTAPQPVGTGGTGATGATDNVQMAAGAGGAAGMMTAPPTSGNSCTGTPPPSVNLTMVADGLVGPTHMAQAPDDPTRLYVTEQRGTVRVIENGVLSSSFALDLRDAAVGAVDATEITPGYGEAGLLAIAFDKDFASNRRLFLSYTSPGLRYTLASFTMTTPGTIDAGSYKQILDFRQYAFVPGVILGTNHIGSMVAWGPDGYLYVSRGDGGGERDAQMSGQDTSDDLCSILRIDPDTYPTPVAGNHDGHVWNYGFRNPWRFSFDRVTGDMYIGDVGQDIGSGYEEINVEPPGVPGRNYGWRALDILGDPAQGPCSGDCGGTTGPALAYPITAEANSVIGGYVYRGAAIAGLTGRYIWADWSERVLKSFVYSGEVNGQPTICDDFELGITVPMKVRSFAEDAAGEIYVLAGGEGSQVSVGVEMAGASVNVPGAIFRIDP